MILNLSFPLYSDNNFKVYIEIMWLVVIDFKLLHFPFCYYKVSYFNLYFLLIDWKFLY